jgi:hypothetical protein
VRPYCVFGFLSGQHLLDRRRLGKLGMRHAVFQISATSEGATVGEDAGCNCPRVSGATPAPVPVPVPVPVVVVIARVIAANEIDIPL